MDKKIEQKIKELRENYLDEQLKKHIEEKAKLEIEIAYQKELDPEEMSAKKPIKFDSNGRPISFRDITRKEHIKLLEESLENRELIIKKIEELYDK